MSDPKSPDDTKPSSAIAAPTAVTADAAAPGAAASGTAPGVASETTAPAAALPFAKAAAGDERGPRSNCLNCSAVMHGDFCYACGQPKKGLIRHFSSIVGDFFDSVLNLDSRTFRTLWPLYFKPGYLSNEYFAGRRVRYVTPLRMYFFLSVVAFLVISAITDIHVENDGKSGVRVSAGTTDKPKDAAKNAAAERDERLKKLDLGLAELPPEQAAQIKEQVGKAMAAEVAGAEAAKKGQRIAEAVKDASEEDEMPTVTFFGNKPWDPVANPVTIDWLSDSLNKSLNDEIGELIRKTKDINKNPAPFVKQVFSLAPQALFVILPLFALLLKIFYLFKRRLYMEHLIVALHSHSFICLSLILIIGLTKIAEWCEHLPWLVNFCGFLRVLAWIWLPLYLLLMQRRVYKQGWIMTVLKYCVIGIAYTMLLAWGMVGTMFVSLVVL
jgi:Protein of unknown function (DUF3667)